MTLSTSRPARRTVPAGSLRLLLFLTVWLTAGVVLAGMVLDARRLEEPSLLDAASMVLLPGTTAALWAWLGPVPVQQLAGPGETRQRAFSVTVALVVVVLLVVGLAGAAALVVLGAGAVVGLLRWREPLRRRETVVALLLGAVAAAAGVADAWVRTDPVGLVFGVFQLPLVTLSLLAGWRLARRWGWSDAGVGCVAALSGGAGAAVRAFLLGAGLSLPWALGNVVNGPPAGDDMRTAWHPVVAALQPGVAEEAWARVLLVTALYAVFVRTARPRPALVAAVLVGSYWFAYLHAPADPLFVLWVGTVYALPMALLWLRRGLEVAIGFHVGLDLSRYVAAYLSAQGLWFL